MVPRSRINYIPLCVGVCLMAPLFFACSEDSVSPRPTGPGLTAVINPDVFSCSYALNAVRGDGAGNVFALGMYGAILKRTEL